MAALVVVALAAWWLTRPASVLAPIRSIAVLPLENLSGDPDQEYFAAGMTEVLIGNLAKIQELRVISRTSVLRHKNTRDPLREVAHLPYFFLLKLWTGIVGETIWGMRSFSALIGALGVFVLGLLGTRLGGRRVGLITAVLAAFNPLQVHYSQEARGYTIWLLAVTLCIYCLYKAADTLNKRWWVVYVVVAWLTVLAHYFTLAWFFGTIGGILIACDRRRFLRHWLVSHAVLAVALLPVLWFLVIPLSEGRMFRLY